MNATFWANKNNSGFNLMYYVHLYPVCIPNFQTLIFNPQKDISFIKRTNSFGTRNKLKTKTFEIKTSFYSLNQSNSNSNIKSANAGVLYKMRIFKKTKNQQL